VPSLIVIWIWLCAYLNCVGWTLSALHQLNAAGYAAALVIFVAGLLLYCKSSVVSKAAGETGSWHLSLKKLRRRFRRPFPLAFLVLAAMAFLGGALYAPSNYDALAYRTPRVLHWLADGQWQWMNTIFDRLNNRSCGMEWVSAPVIALLHTTRLLFLTNSISFLFLPGLVFSVFTRLRVRPRVAWHWMWLAPTGYCFLLQAGSIGNDLFGAIFALASIDFALRARMTGSFTALATSIFAAAMMTSAKTNNLPLLLPWAVALLPSFKLIFRRPAAALLVTVAAMVASALPTIYFNWKYSGDWSGAGLTNAGVKHAAIYRSGANIFSLAQQNLAPPVFPVAAGWNQFVKNHLPPLVSAKTEALIEMPGCWFPLPQMQTEENAGLGFGVSGLLAISFFTALVGGKGPRLLTFTPEAAVRWAALMAVFALLTQSNISTIGRLFCAFYLLPAAIVLAMPGQGALVRRRWWRVLAWMVFVMAAGLLVISPARPLFPRNILLEQISSQPQRSTEAARLADVYSVYRDRPHAFAPLLEALPPETRIIGYIAYDRPETSLWLPLGSRRVVQVYPGDEAADLKSRGVGYILANANQIEARFGPASQWLQKINAIVIKTIPLRPLASKPVENWMLIRLQ
jgi:hypothetical protein